MCFCILFLFAMGPAQAQQKKLKMLISADMEGVGGVSAWAVQADSKGREYEKFRRLMTLEVNAAIAGAAEAGATEFIVGDSHAGAQNIDIELLDKRARLIRAWPRPLEMMPGVDSACDAVYLRRLSRARGCCRRGFGAHVHRQRRGEAQWRRGAGSGVQRGDRRGFWRSGGIRLRRPDHRLGGPGTSRAD